MQIVNVSLFNRIYLESNINLNNVLFRLPPYISGWIFEKVIDSYKPSVPSTPPPPLPNFPVPSSYKNGNCLNIRTTISDNNIGQWLPFPPYPLPNAVLQIAKKNRKKSRHHCSNIERGEAGEGFLLRVARDFWLRLYSLYMLGISMGLFQACHAIDFQKDII